MALRKEILVIGFAGALAASSALAESKKGESPECTNARAEFTRVYDVHQKSCVIRSRDGVTLFRSSGSCDQLSTQQENLYKKMRTACEKK